MNLNERSAIVTGASLGIGLSLTEALIARGARVAGLARDAGRLQKVSERLGSAFLPLACDVGELSQVERAVRSAGRGLMSTACDTSCWPSPLFGSSRSEHRAKLTGLS